MTIAFGVACALALTFFVAWLQDLDTSVVVCLCLMVVAAAVMAALQ